ncbi:MAG: LuxR C-terminal-related transcriptional regulator [Gaiellaceae bacterium]
MARVAQAVVPAAGKRLEQRLRVAQSPETAAQPLAELLAEDLRDWPPEAWLVIDDYHELADSAPSEEFVAALLELAPVQLLVTTRKRPGWVTARRTLHGEVTEIVDDQLAMTNEEARAVLAKIPKEAVSALVDRAEGWPALIGLARLSAAAGLPEAKFADALFRYFAEEFLRREPEPVRSFMLAASVPVSIDLRSAREVFGLAEAEGALNRLQEEGVLHDVVGGGLRFHPLLREFLRKKLEAEDPELEGRLRALAVEDARLGGRLEEAFELALEGGAVETATAIASEASSSLLDAGRIETVERWLSACGAHALGEPALGLARAEILLRRDRYAEAAAAALDLAEHLPAGDPRRSRAWYVAGWASHLMSDDERALECYLMARDTALDPRDAQDALWAATAPAAELDSAAVGGLVTELEALAGGDREASIKLVPGRVIRASQEGSLAGLWESVAPLIEPASCTPDPAVRTIFFLNAAYLAAARADYETAFELAAKSLATCDEFRLGIVRRMFCLCQRAAAEMGLRRLQDAQRTLKEIAELDGGTNRALASEQRILTAKLAVMSGRPERLLVKTSQSGGLDEPAWAAGELLGLVAIAAAAGGDPERARAEAQPSQALTGWVEGRFYSRFAFLIAGLLEGRPDAADEAGRLIIAAAEAGIADAAVVAYRAYPPLLGVLGNDAQALEVMRPIIRSANDHALAAEAGIEIPGPDRRERPLLTAREEEVLRLMCEGLGNAEISQRLFISEKTTKVHASHIFEKLGVRSRVQAVLAAQSMAAPDRGPE